MCADEPAIYHPIPFAHCERSSSVVRMWHRFRRAVGSHRCELGHNELGDDSNSAANLFHDSRHDTASHSGVPDDDHSGVHARGWR